MPSPLRFTDYDTRLAAYALLVDEDERVLLTWYNGSRRNAPGWSLPGGGVDYDETPEQAVVREVHQEAGYDVVVGAPLVPRDRLSALPDRRAGMATAPTDLRTWMGESAPGSDPVVAAAMAQAAAWLEAGEPSSVAPASDLMFSHADGNLGNLVWDGTTCRVVDFEDSGVSDLAYEVADLLEHATVSLAGLVDDAELVAILGLSADQQERLLDRRRLMATFWLLMLLPGHPGEARNPPGSLDVQARRVLGLLA